MAKDLDRRLKALERQVATSGSEAEFERLLALARVGQLGSADLSRMTDQQVWALVCAEPFPLPEGEALDPEG